MYKNDKGENRYKFGWLQADPESNVFSPTSGGNDVWAKSKRDAIAKVNREHKEFEKENTDHCKLRVNPTTIKRVKNYEEFAKFSRGLYMMTI